MIPTKLKFVGKVESSSSRAYKSNLAPQNTSTFGFGDTIIINVPTRNNLVLSTVDSYLKFQVPSWTAGANGSTFRFGSAGAAGIFQRIRVWSGSNLLEDITEFGLLYSILNDLQVSSPSFYGKNTILQGTRGDYVLQLPVHTTAALTGGGTYTDTLLNGAINNAFSTTYDNACLQVNPVNSGATLLNATTTGSNNIIANNELTVPQTFCIPLVSIMGTLCSHQYFPLFACKSSAIRIEITLNNSLQQMGMVLGSFTCPLGVINKVEYVAQMMELSDQAMSVIQSSLASNPLQFVIPSWKNLQYTTSQLTGGTNSSVSFAIAAKYSSLKNIIISQRDNGGGGLTGYFPHSSVTGGITSANYRIGSELFPPKAADNFPEMYCEVIKAISSISDLSHMPPINLKTYTLPASVISTAAQEKYNAGIISGGCYYNGLDCEQYNSAEKTQIFAGLSTLNSDIYYQASYTPANNITLRLDAFTCFDALIVFENDVAYMKS